MSPTARPAPQGSPNPGPTWETRGETTSRPQAGAPRRSANGFPETTQVLTPSGLGVPRCWCVLGLRTRFLLIRAEKAPPSLGWSRKRSGRPLEFRCRTHCHLCVRTDPGGENPSADDRNSPHCSPEERPPAALGSGAALLAEGRPGAETEPRGAWKPCEGRGACPAGWLSPPLCLVRGSGSWGVGGGAQSSETDASPGRPRAPTLKGQPRASKDRMLHCFDRNQGNYWDKVPVTRSKEAPPESTGPCRVPTMGTAPERLLRPVAARPE